MAYEIAAIVAPQASFASKRCGTGSSGVQLIFLRDSARSCPSGTNLTCQDMRCARSTFRHESLHNILARFDGIDSSEQALCKIVLRTAIGLWGSDLQSGWGMAVSGQGR